jgi:hypothetical protein
MAGGTSAYDGAVGRDTVFVLARGYRVPLLRRGAVALVFAGGAAALASSGFLPLLTWAAAAVFGAATVYQATLYVWQGRFRTRLSAQGIEARGYFDHFIPWSDVIRIDAGRVTAAGAQARPISGTPWDSPASQPLSRVAQRSEGGYRARLAAVRVTKRSGRSLLLRAPLVTSWQDDSQFQDKARLIEQWWQRYSQGSAAQSH